MSGGTLTGLSGRFLDQPVLLARLVIAVVQAAALYLLMEAADAQSWPASMPWLFAPMLLIAVFVPLILLYGAGTLRARPLALWAIGASLVIAGLGCHDALRGRVAEFAGDEVFWPLPRLWLALAAGVFVAHALVVDSLASGRLRPPYPRHFDTAWKQGVQGVLAAGFVGVFWIILYLGAGLFSLVEVELFERVIERRWFAFPATALALAVSLHVTDVQPSLMRGARTVALLLFSWLLPLLALILLGFLGSLPFISLEPLWNTRSAAMLLLIAAGLLVFLMNSSYHDGAAAQVPPGIRRYAIALGALELLPLTGLAAWALFLRVDQYGWTVDRILAAAVILVAACYALGYSAAAVRSPGGMKGIEPTNVATAYLCLGLLLVLFTPLGDPSRLMVASQLARLESGEVPADRFDYAALKFDGAGWGTAALAELGKREGGQDAATVRRKAVQALDQDSRYRAGQPADWQAAPGELATRVTVFPAGRTLPDAFYESLARASADDPIPLCLRTEQPPCLARLVELAAGEGEAILLLDRWAGYLYERDGAAGWQLTGGLASGSDCVPLRRGVEEGSLDVQAPRWPDLVAEGRRFVLRSDPNQDCQ